MPAQTFLPGPAPNTVINHTGQILPVPHGWELLTPGDAALTRRVKAAGEHWLVQEKVGRKVFSRGVSASAALFWNFWASTSAGPKRPSSRGCATTRRPTTR
jgi:hypothetical protein